MAGELTKDQEPTKEPEQSPEHQKPLPTNSAREPSALETEMAQSQLRKLQLEVLALERQNTWKGQVVQFATAFTVLATVFGIWQGIEKFRSDRQKDRDLAEKDNSLRRSELIERLTNQYRSDLKQLLMFPIDEKQTIPLVIETLQDLDQLIQSIPQQQEGSDKKLKADVGTLLANLTRSGDCDLEKRRNVEFERTVLQYWPGYSSLLVEQPETNIEVISEYFGALRHLHEVDKKFFESVAIDSSGGFNHNPAMDDINFIPFIDLFRGYKEHVELLKKSLEVQPEQASRINDDLDQAFCWFYWGTENKPLTRNIFNIGDADLEKRANRCP